MNPKPTGILISFKGIEGATKFKIRRQMESNPNKTQYRRNKLDGLEIVNLVKRDTHLGKQYEWSLTEDARLELKHLPDSSIETGFLPVEV